MPYLQSQGNIHNLLKDRYGYLGNSYIEMILYILSHPLEMCKALFNKPLLLFFLSFALLPLLYLKLTIFGLPSLFINLLSKGESQSNLALYYTMSAIPFFLISTLYALKKFNQKWRRGLVLFFLIISMTSYRTNGCMIPSRNDITAHNLFASFYTDDQISAQSNIVPHLPRYTNISIYPERNKKTGYIMLKLTGFNGILNKTRKEYYSEILNIIENQGFIAEEYLFPYVILKKEINQLEINNNTLKLRNDLLKLIGEK